jgi:foldase protein PrsA
MFEGADGEGRLLDFKQRLLDNLINQKLIEQAAADQKIEVTDADVKKQVDQLKSGFKDDAQFQAALKSAGMDAEGLTKQIKDQLITQKLIEKLSKNTTATPAEMQAYYAKNKAQFEQKAAKRAEHILFKPEDKKTAQKVLDELKSGGDFSALAKKYSVDTATAAKGGDLGWPTTPYVPEFEAALAKLKKGQTSALVQTPYGWHIIRVTDTREGTQQKFEQVKDQIDQILIQQKRAEAYQKYLDGLKKKAKIEILIEELKVGSAASTPATATK